MAVILFDAWFPALVGTLLILLAIEQLYLFTFIITGYRISGDRLLMMVAGAFLAFSIGSILSALVNFTAFSLFSDGYILPGYETMHGAMTLLTTFEIMGFASFLIFPVMARRTEAGLTAYVPVWLALLYENRFYIHTLAAILIIILIYMIFQNARKLLSWEIDTILLGLVFLVIAKVIVLVPYQGALMNIFSILFEVLAFSSFILLKDMVSFTIARVDKS